MLVLVSIAVLGGLGTLIRFHFGGYVHLTINRIFLEQSRFPWGTLAVNVVGSLLLGLLAGWAESGRLDPQTATVLGAGLCGSLTTLSAVTVDLAECVHDRKWLKLAVRLAANVVPGLAAVWLGLWLAG
jgi:CrcB protein